MFNYLPGFAFLLLLLSVVLLLLREEVQLKEFKRLSVFAESTSTCSAFWE